MSFIGLLRTLHVVSGGVAMAAMAIPLLSRKGGPVHRRSGRVFFTALFAVAATALLTCVYRLATPSSIDVRRMAIVLGFVSLLAANSARTALRVFRFKERTGRHRVAVDILLPSAVVAGGATLAAWGQLTGFPLAIAFGILGIVVAVRQLRYWLREPVSPLHWKYQHMQSAVGAAIAATTAFLVVNVKPAGVPTTVSLLVWLGPTLIGLPGVLLWIARLRAREAEGAAASLAA